MIRLLLAFFLAFSPFAAHATDAPSEPPTAAAATQQEAQKSLSRPAARKFMPLDRKKLIVRSRNTRQPALLRAPRPKTLNRPRRTKLERTLSPAPVQTDSGTALPSTAKENQ